MTLHGFQLVQFQPGDVPSSRAKDLWVVAVVDPRASTRRKRITDTHTRADVFAKNQVCRQNRSECLDPNACVDFPRDGYLSPHMFGGAKEAAHAHRLANEIGEAGRGHGAFLSALQSQQTQEKGTEQQIGQLEIHVKKYPARHGQKSGET